MKKYIILILAAAIAVGLSSCGGDNPVSAPDMTTADIPSSVSETTAQKSTDLPILTALIDAQLSNSPKLSEVGDDYVTGMMEIDLSGVESYVLKIQTSGTEVDQYGVFIAKDETGAKALLADVNSYLDTLRESWENFDYLPEEAPKIDEAEAVQSGRYVLYVVADKAEKKAVIQLFEDNVG